MVSKPPLAASLNPQFYLPNGIYPMVFIHFFGGERPYRHKALQRLTSMGQRDVPGQDTDGAKGNFSIYRYLTLDHYA
jgi:hypothetical protein